MVVMVIVLVERVKKEFIMESRIYELKGYRLRGLLVGGYLGRISWESWFLNKVLYLGWWRGDDNI